LGEGAIDFFILGDVAHEALRARQRVDEILRLFRETLVLIGDGQLHSGGVQALRDGPRNRALVGDSEDNRRPAFQLKGHGFLLVRSEFERISERWELRALGWELRAMRSALWDRWAPAR
jgi:hypothetical protein